MKQIIKSGIMALVLVLALSCKKETSISKSLAVNSNSSTEELLTKIDGAAAVPVKIGTQRWMATNLSVTRYRNGDIIPQVKDSAAWAALTTGAWCYYKNDRANGAIYGKLYNWYAVNDIRGLAPVGYHIPTDGEWTTLAAFLGGDPVAGGKMKSIGTIEAGTGLWYSPNVDATNSTGFTGNPGGYRNNNSLFYYIGYNGYFWSSTDNSNNVDAYYRNLNQQDGYLFRTYLNKGYGFSVRCVKD